MSTRASVPITGQPPNPARLPKGCTFHPRCPIGRDRPLCQSEEPPLAEADPGHRSACHYADEVAKLAAAPGADFSALARTWSEDITASSGGNLGQRAEKDPSVIANPGSEEEKFLFAAIRKKMQDAWDAAGEGSAVSGRNKLVSTRVRVRATGTYNEIDPNQANAQIVLPSADALEIVKR